MAKSQPKRGAADASRNEAEDGLARPLSIIALAAVLIFGTVYFLWRGGNFANPPPKQTFISSIHPGLEELRDVCGPQPEDGQTTAFSLIYGPEIAGFMELVVEQFTRLCPTLVIKRQVRDALEVAAIPAERRESALWLPGSELALSLAGLPVTEGPAAAPLASVLFRSPQVFLAWEDRALVVSQLRPGDPRRDGIWRQLGCPSGEPNAGAPAGAPGGTWSEWLDAAFPRSAGPPRNRKRKETQEPPRQVPAELVPYVEELGRWGRIKLLHSSPVRSLAGLSVLYMISYDYLWPAAQRGAGTLPADSLAAALAQRAPLLGQWLGRCEGKDGPLAESAAACATQFMERGPARADVLALNENQALELLVQAATHGQSLRGLRVLYPETGLRNEYRAIYLESSASAAATPQERQAATRFVAFLMTDAVQKLAIEHGLRPAKASVAIRDYDVPTNLFLKLRRYGIELEPRQQPPTVLPADGIRKLMRIWEDATGMN